jgi:hypothetical protein
VSAIEEPGDRGEIRFDDRVSMHFVAFPMLMDGR